MNDSPLKPASSRRKKMDKTMMAIYFLILFIVAGAALLAFLCLSKPSDKKNKAGSDPSIACLLYTSKVPYRGIWQSPPRASSFQCPVLP